MSEYEVCFECGNCVVVKVYHKSGRYGFETLQLGATAMYRIGSYGSNFYFRAVEQAYDNANSRYQDR